MKKWWAVSAVLLLLAIGSGNAFATGFYADTDELGYLGTIWNITDGTGPWTTSTPRDASLFMTSNAAHYYADSNILLSSWWEHRTSNQNDSFLQLYDEGNLTVTSAYGWWDASLTKFSLTVTGQNAPYPWSRFWQPDNGVAWGVTFTDYTYSFEAIFSTAAALDSNGFYVNTSAPDSITGSFTGEFVVTYDVSKNPITDGDTYGFDIQLSSAQFDPDGGTGSNGVGGDYGTITPYAAFGSTEVVPEPATMLLLGIGLIGLAGTARRKVA